MAGNEHVPNLCLLIFHIIMNNANNRLVANSFTRVSQVSQDLLLRVEHALLMSLMSYVWLLLL